MLPVKLTAERRLPDVSRESVTQTSLTYPAYGVPGVFLRLEYDHDDGPGVVRFTSKWDTLGSSETAAVATCVRGKHRASTKGVATGITIIDRSPAPPTFVIALEGVPTTAEELGRVSVVFTGVFPMVAEGVLEADITRQLDSQLPYFGTAPSTATVCRVISILLTEEEHRGHLRIAVREGGDLAATAVRDAICSELMRLLFEPVGTSRLARRVGTVAGSISQSVSLTEAREFERDLSLRW